MSEIRRYIKFYGRVQGVGFRYRAYYAARNFDVKGWVRNCCDGSVEMEVQSLEENIDKMIMTIEKGTFVMIENMECKSLPLKDEQSFIIKD